MAAALEAVIGLEVHAQLQTRTKLFCGCSTEPGQEPNRSVCPVCLGLPGALPVLNREAVRQAICVGLALESRILPSSRFARKNYFYPDLPKGYQISQFDLPIVQGGTLEIGELPGERSIRICRAHLEEDAAKNLHGERGEATRVDFNRAGIPLLEIVTEPDLRSPEEAERYLQRLRETLVFLGVNDGNLEEGSFRCDANVSLRPVGEARLGTRTELKNINSFRFVRLGLEAELRRQRALLSSGGSVTQQTRAYLEAEGKTVALRSKEEAEDYRYFPDPDLPPIRITEARVAALRLGLPELPPALRRRLCDELGVTAADAEVLTSHPAIARYFEEVARGCAEALGVALPQIGKAVANFVQSELLRDVRIEGLEARFPLPSSALIELICLMQEGTISGKIAKGLLPKMRETGLGARAIVAQEGLVQLTDPEAIEAHVRAVIEASPAQLAAYRAGKEKLFGYFVGQIMKATGGRANPALVNEILRRNLRS
ncbi:MAG: Asp-tRNA(Asn)/Glu-tRNA(Gln) amidotransferase subunit GatB [Myxococcales bacterium]|nr:Asp-tRNA(Asn)/Glu-tRNA(Gln) amidotransferase subunit GatB [Myxococcales bacterium]